MHLHKSSLQNSRRILIWRQKPCWSWPRFFGITRSSKCQKTWFIKQTPVWGHTICSMRKGKVEGWPSLGGPWKKALSLVAFLHIFKRIFCQFYSIFASFPPFLVMYCYTLPYFCHILPFYATFGPCYSNYLAIFLAFFNLFDHYYPLICHFKSICDFFAHFKAVFWRLAFSASPWKKGPFSLVAW